MPPCKSSIHALRTLQLKWLRFFAISLVVISGFSIFAYGSLGKQAALWWAISTGALAYQMLNFRKHLTLNVTRKTRRLAAVFGLGNQLSLFRLLCIALLTGFLGQARPVAGLAWAPFALYLFANVVDLFDGFAARTTGFQTPLGEKLDVDLDGRGLLIASALVYQYGQVGWWFLLVGFARYIFLLGSWLRQRRGLRVFKLKESFERRALAGTQMGLCTALLAPVFSPPETTVAAAIFMVPFLANFSYDWLQVSGRAGGIDLLLQRFQGWQRVVAKWLPLILRIFAGAILYQWAALGSSFLPLAGLNTFLAAALLSGTAGRAVSIIVLIEIGFLSILQPDWVLMFCCTGVLFLGTGPFSLWKPENYLINQRLGER